MSVLEMILYPLLAVIMIIWLVLIIRKYKKNKKLKEKGIDTEDEN